MAMVQLRVNDQMKKDAQKVFEDLGLDMSTAIRMFLKRSIDAKGIPFPTSEEDLKPYNYEEVMRNVRAMQQAAEEAGISNMTLDEINAEIRASRAERQAREEMLMRKAS